MVVDGDSRGFEESSCEKERRTKVRARNGKMGTRRDVPSIVNIAVLASSFDCKEIQREEKVRDPELELDGRRRTPSKLANKPMPHRLRAHDRSELSERGVKILSGDGRIHSTDSKVVRVDDRSVGSHLESSSSVGYLEAMAAKKTKSQLG